MKNNNRGFGVIEVALVVCIIGAGGWIYHQLNKPVGKVDGTPIADVNKIKEEAAAAAAKHEKEVLDEDKRQLSMAQAGVHATGSAIDAAALKASAGKDPSREISTAKDVNQLTQDAIDNGLNQPVDPKLMKWFMDVIDKKNSDIQRERDLGAQMLNSKSTELQASIDREVQARKDKLASDAEWRTKLAAAEQARDKWALENEVKAQKLDRIYFWVYTAAGIWLLAILLPVIAKVFPAVTPLANVAGAVVGPMIQWGKGKADNLATDLVALQQHAKDYIANIDPAKVQAYKDSVSAWWEKDVASQAAVEQMKSKLRI